ncbi:flagellar biosynthesis protein FlhF [Zooshikella harenae]|uniref:Flagellar biosynthesis protein FlhF n=1 Tax=Zooshikella harenae TaxID=2827238 RepID=A0ABS5Z8Q9_9GAMM|nr:flagellar biosynthesis protein FlhF [Zooshikella harenae]MBU2710436.1 flagellar biosynthesis protein FlhF [Zooshikella harenae]
MNIKRYFAADMRQALKLVKQELGADATILEQRRVAGGIELVVARDVPTIPSHVSASQASANIRNHKDAPYKQQSSSPKSKRTFSQDNEFSWQGHHVNQQMQTEGSAKQNHHQSLVDLENYKQANRLRNGKSPKPSPSEAQHQTTKQGQPWPNTSAYQDVQSHKQHNKPEVQWQQRQALAEPKKERIEQTGETAPGLLANLQQELHGMRMLLQQQMGQKAWGDFCQLHPVAAMVWRRLVGMGLSPQRSHTIVQNLPADTGVKAAWRQVLGQLSRLLNTTKRDLVDGGGIFALLGTTGSGKTTTVGKLAARYALKHGTESLGLITLDTFRIGACDQLKTLGRILNVPIRVVSDVSGLQQALDAFRGKSLILIDTAGLHPQDDNLQLQLNLLDQVRPMIRNLLVLATTSQRAVLQRAIDTYSTEQTVGTILTKVDETHSLGESLDMVIAGQLAVSYYTDGQRIPEDIALARSHTLLSRAVAISGALDEDDAAWLVQQEWTVSGHSLFNERAVG